MADTVRKTDYGRIGIILLTLALAALCAAMLGLLIYRAGFRVPINGNEGWNALHADDALSMLNFYEPDGFANFPNYPPLSFYIVGGLGRIIGDNVFAGRWIALLSILILTLNMGLIAARIGATRANAVLAALIGLLFFLLLFPGYVMMNDPQWIGHAFQSTALVLLLAPGNAGRKTGTLVAVMALSLAGGLIKHNLAVVPLAITIWLASPSVLQRRRKLRRPAPCSLRCRA